MNSDEPLYGAHYLPRKFKIGIAHPTDNSIDVLTQDVAFVPVASDGRADGSVWDLYSGGGLGLTHNNPRTARAARALSGPDPPRAGRAGGARDRDPPEGARRTQGPQAGALEVHDPTAGRRGRPRGARSPASSSSSRPPSPAPLPPMQLHLGWHAQAGRPELLRDLRRERPADAGAAARGAQRRREPRPARAADGRSRTCCSPTWPIGPRSRGSSTRAACARPESVSLVRRNAMACPAKPTCGLAMTEAERILPTWIDGIEAAGLGGVDVVIRMTGCPNNCARPPTAEIGIFGYGKNDHVVLVGGSREGTRLAHELYARVPGERMLEALVGLLRAIRDAQSAGSAGGGVPAPHAARAAAGVGRPRDAARWLAQRAAWYIAPARARAGRTTDRPEDRVEPAFPPIDAHAARGRAPGRPGGRRGPPRARAGRAARREPGRPGRARGRARGRLREQAARQGRRSSASRATSSSRSPTCVAIAAPTAPSRSSRRFAATRRPTRSTRSREVTRGGVRAGCIEALFCLGDKPEIAYRAYREWLAQRGLRTTAEYLVQACEVAFEIGMLPHTNAGILRREEMERAQARERVAGADARVDEPAPAREGRRPLLGARQGSRRAPPHARGGRRAPDPLHQRHPARHRRDGGRARRHAARDPRPRRSPTGTSRK